MIIQRIHKNRQLHTGSLFYMKVQEDNSNMMTQAMQEDN